MRVLLEILPSSGTCEIVYHNSHNFLLFGKDNEKVLNFM